uniref:ribosomal protein L32 n=1 Tax=Chlorococcum tatrense TaxID=915274 RepID=UPI0010C28DE5
QKRTSKSKKNIRKNAWKTKVEKQVVRSLFLAKYLLKTKPEDPAVEKLLNRLNDETIKSDENNSK